MKLGRLGFLVLAICCVLSCVRQDALAQEKTVPPETLPTTMEQRRALYMDYARAQKIGRYQMVEGKPWFIGQIPDPGKFTWNHLFALLEQDPTGNQKVPNGDCTVNDLIHALFQYKNMFHFNADGPALCLMKYPKLVSAEDRKFLFEGHDRSVLNHPTEPNYNLFTGEGTENHLMMGRFSGYLYCQNWLKDHPDDERAKKGLEDCKTFILDRAKHIYRGGSGEYNSSTYYGYTMRGAFACYDYAEDPQVKAACKAILDYFAAELSLKYVNGLNAAPESRGADTASCEHDADQFVWYWFGDSPVVPTEATNLTYICASGYRPPEVLGKIARKEVPAGAFYYNSHPEYLLDGPGFSRENIYFGPSYAMSCMYMPTAGFTGACVQFCPSKIVARSNSRESAWVMIGNSNTLGTRETGRGPWDQWGLYKNVLIQFTRVPENAKDLIQAADAITADWSLKFGESFAARWPGSGDHNPVGPKAPRTENVDSYLMYKVGNPKGVVVVRDETNGIVFLKYDDTYMAVRSLHEKMPKLEENYDPDNAFVGRNKKGKGKEPEWNYLVDPVGPGAGVAGFVVEAGSKAEQQSFENFQKEIAAKTSLDQTKLAEEKSITYTNLRGEKITFHYNSVAAKPLIEPIFDWGYIADASLNHPMPVPHKPPFEQPTYPAPGASLDGWGRIPEITVNGKPLGGANFLNTSVAWPVFYGPNIKLDKGILTIDDGKDWYVVDYSGDQPKWTKGSRSGK